LCVDHQGNFLNESSAEREFDLRAENDMSDFSNKVVVITGGASGIGEACARLFAKRGASVVVADVNEKGAAVVEAIRTEGGRAVFTRTDVTQRADCESMVKAAIDNFGRLDCAANMAGLSLAGGIFAPHEARDRLINVNLTGTFNAVVAEAAAMKAHGGAIVNCSSITGLQGSADSPYYVASKHGVIGFTKSAALELAKWAVRVNAICPGFTLTPMTRDYFGDNVDALGANLVPLGRIGTPADQAATVVWLCSDEAAYISGAYLSVDGGLAAGPKSYRDTGKTLGGS
jgi:NAD(P)-dependent dehydrogenase (short-subunit alcohol dehydrogenase family)